MIEDGFARLDRAQQRFDLVEQFAIENAGLPSSGVHVVLKNVPAGEDQIVEAGQGDELLDLGRARVGALAETNGCHLRDRTDGLGDSLAYGFDAGHKCGRDRAHARNHYAKFAFGGLNLAAVVFLAFRSCGLLPNRHRVEASL